MKKLERTKTATPPPEKKNPAPPTAKLNPPAPMFVEADKMFDRLARLTEETAERAFDYFLRRGGNWGHEFDDWFRAETEILRPLPVELKEKNGSLIVNAVVAGFKPEEIEINVKDNLLTISGDHKMNRERKDENVVYSDFASNRFFRQMRLPQIVDASKVEAKLEDGVLHITLPKMAVQEANHIAVSAG
jgi:HSP20 family protein